MKQLLSLVVLAAVVGCNSAPAKFDSVVGSYEGKGKFDGGGGSMKLDGGIMLGADGRYDLKLSLGSIGSESGTYTLQGNVLMLVPDRAEANAAATLENALSKSRRDKTMQVSEGFTSIKWSDGPMQMEFARKAS